MTTHAHRPAQVVSTAPRAAIAVSPSLQAIWILRLGFTVAPILGAR